MQSFELTFGIEIIKQEQQRLCDEGYPSHDELMLTLENFPAMLKLARTHSLYQSEWKPLYDDPDIVQALQVNVRVYFYLL